MSESVKEPDKHLPHAHTCFFSIQLPPYSSPAVLRERLVYAMWNCGSSLFLSLECPSNCFKLPLRASGSMNADVNLKDSELYNYDDEI
jgi:hypothetical protein